MNTLPVIASCLLALLLTAASSFGASPELKATLNSTFIVPGEATLLTLSIQSEKRPVLPPAAPQVPNVTFSPRPDGIRPIGGQRYYIYTFLVRSFEEGTHIIPPLSVTVGARTFYSQPLQLHVSRLDVDNWNTQRIAGEEVRYAGAVFVPKRVPYVGEAMPAEAKIYLPATSTISEVSIAEVEQDGVVAWRFEAPKSPETRVRLNNQEYVGITFRSTTSPIRAGEVSLGPGKARLILTVRTDNRGQFRWTPIPVTFELPPHRFTAKPLPPNPPAGFAGAVGTFQLSALAETGKLEEGDPITVRLTVAGRGNLDSLAAPELEADASVWKSYEPSRLARQGERRDVSGVVTFSQIIRPLLPQNSIPPFRLAYFDPARQRYEVVRTAPIPFTLLPTASSQLTKAPILPDISTPVEEMESILGIVNPARSLPSGSSPNWWRLWQWIPALVAVALLFRIAQRRLLPRFKRPVREQELLRALATVEQAGPGAREFLRASGHFIESWIPDSQRDEDLQELLERRDTDCFRPDAGELALGNDERRGILKRLRDSALAGVQLLTLVAVLAISGVACGAEPGDPATKLSLYNQASAAWGQGSYQTAIEFYRSAHPDGSLPADVLFNIGNCYFQLEEPGLAALYYHRALHADPQHPEAQQNLRFLKRKLGSITINRPTYQEWLGKLDREIFTSILWAGIWVTGLSLLGTFALVAKPLRALTWCGLVAGPLTAAAAGASLYYYPNDAEFAPAETRAIVITPEATTARTEAGSIRIQTAGGEAPKVIDAPPGSVCRVLAIRGAWYYVEFADRTRGWLSSREVETVIPQPDASLVAPLGGGA